MQDRSNWKENDWVKLRFERVNPSHILKKLKKYYTYVRHASSPRATDVMCIALYVMTYMLVADGKPRYSQAWIRKFMDIHYVRKYHQLLERHERRMVESEIYFERFILFVRDLHKIELKQKERIYKRRVSSVLEVSRADEESKQAQSSNSRISNESEVMRQIEDDKF